MNSLAYYQRSRTHLALQKDTPEARTVYPATAGSIVVRPEVGGLHHPYERQAACCPSSLGLRQDLDVEDCQHDIRTAPPDRFDGLGSRSP